MRWLAAFGVAMALAVGGAGAALTQGIGTAGYEINYGNEYFAARKFDLAAMRYTQATQLDPRNAEAYFLLAKANLELGRAAEAKAALDKAYALDPKLRNRATELPAPATPAVAAPGTWTGLAVPPGGVGGIGTAANQTYYGKQYLAKGEYALAAMRFRQALQLDPNYAEASFWLAGALKGAGDAGGSAQALDKAFKLDPSLKAHQGELAQFTPPPPKPVAPPAPQAKAPAPAARKPATAANDCDGLYSACYVSATRCSLYNNNGCTPDFAKQSMCMTERNACYARNGKR